MQRSAFKKAMKDEYDLNMFQRRGPAGQRACVSKGEEGVSGD